MIALGLNSCYYDRRESLYPNAEPCDSVNVSFSSRVAPILAANCYTCHSQAAAIGKVVLEGYDNVKTVATNGRLLGAVAHLPGYRPMPDGGQKLSDCNVAIIRNWIKEGAKDN